MFADEIRRAVEAAPRTRLPEIAKALWSALAGGQINETEAGLLSARIDARRAIPVPSPARSKIGARPRSPASIERRRRWAASGALPVGLASRFTIAEQAVLAVIADQIVRHGRCALFVGHVAALAGVGETTVRNALREARQLGLIAVEIRRVSAWRNDANLVTIISAEWSSWLACGGRRGGFKSAQGTVSRSSEVAGRRTSEGLGRAEEVETSRNGFRGGGSDKADARSRMALRSPYRAVQGDERQRSCLVPDFSSRPPRAS